MDVVEDNARREALAQRMSKLLGLPITNIQLLMPLVSQADLAKLENLPDDQFLSQATKIINAAQKRQFEEEASVSSAPAEDEAPPPVMGAPLDIPPEPPKKKKVGRKGAEPAAEPAAAADDLGAAAADMPAAFQRPVKKESILADKRALATLVGASVAGLVILGCAVWLGLMWMKSGNTVKEKPAVADGAKAPDTVEAPVAITFQHQWGLRMAGPYDQLVQMPQAIADDGAMTVELWVLPMPSGQMPAYVRVFGEGRGFVLDFARQPDMTFMVRFGMVQIEQLDEPSLADDDKLISFIIPAEAAGKLIHLTGTQDPSLASPSMALYVGGMLVGEKFGRRISAGGELTAYHVSSGVPGGAMAASGNLPPEEGIAIDEVRVSAGRIYQGQTVNPPRILTADGNTRSLLHLEKWDEAATYVYEAAVDPPTMLQLNAGAGDMASVGFVPLTATTPEGSVWMPKAADVPMAEIAFPPDLLQKLTERTSRVFARRVLDDWAKMSREERLAYLRKINYPLERLDQKP